MKTKIMVAIGVCVMGAALLRDMMHTSAEAFEAVMKLDLPDLAAFNDADIVSEFEGITERLLAENPK